MTWALFYPQDVVLFSFLFFLCSGAVEGGYSTMISRSQFPSTLDGGTPDTLSSWGLVTMELYYHHSLALLIYKYARYLQARNSYSRFEHCSCTYQSYDMISHPWIARFVFRAVGLIYDDYIPVIAVLSLYACYVHMRGLWYSRLELRDMDYVTLSYQYIT